MTIRHAFKARKFFPNAPRRQAASQAVKYGRAIDFLGDRWILAKQTGRLTPTPRAS